MLILVPQVLEKLAYGYRIPKPASCSQEIYDSIVVPCWGTAKARPSFSTLADAAATAFEALAVTHDYLVDGPLLGGGIDEQDRMEDKPLARSLAAQLDVATNDVSAVSLHSLASIVSKTRSKSADRSLETFPASRVRTQDSQGDDTGNTSDTDTDTDTVAVSRDGSRDSSVGVSRLDSDPTDMNVMVPNINSDDVPRLESDGTEFLARPRDRVVSREDSSGAVYGQGVLTSRIVTLLQQEDHVAKSAGKMADAGLVAQQEQLAAALANSSGTGVTQIIASFLDKDAPMQNMVPLCERSGALLLQYCLAHLETTMDTGAISPVDLPPLWTSLLVAVGHFFTREIGLAKLDIDAVTAKAGALGDDDKATAMYNDIMRQTSLDDPHSQPPKFNNLFSRHYEKLCDLNTRLADRIRQQHPSGCKICRWVDKPGKDPVPLQRDTDVLSVHAAGHAILPYFKTLVEDIASTIPGCDFSAGPRKKLWRSLEKRGVSKNVLETLHDGSTLIDVVRGTVIMDSFDSGSSFLDYFMGCDEYEAPTSSYSSAGFAEKHGRIVIVSVKNKWKKPAAGGWCCGQLYFYFFDDPHQHICELQVVHNRMQAARKGIPNQSYEAYSLNRCFGELLKVVQGDQNPESAERVGGKRAAMGGTSVDAVAWGQTRDSNVGVGVAMLHSDSADVDADACSEDSYCSNGSNTAKIYGREIFHHLEPTPYQTMGKPIGIWTPAKQPISITGNVANNNTPRTVTRATGAQGTGVRETTPAITTTATTTPTHANTSTATGRGEDVAAYEARLFAAATASLPAIPASPTSCDLVASATDTRGSAVGGGDVVTNARGSDYFLASATPTADGKSHYDGLAPAGIGGGGVVTTGRGSDYFLASATPSIGADGDTDEEEGYLHIGDAALPGTHATA